MNNPHLGEGAAQIDVNPYTTIAYVEIDIFQELIDEFGIEELSMQEHITSDPGVYYDIFRADCVMIQLYYVGTESIPKFTSVMDNLFDNVLPRLEKIGYRMKELDSPVGQYEIEIYYPN